LIQFTFKKDKAIEAILYIVNEVNGLDVVLLSDILYKADKLHLEKWGRFIFGESYQAMSLGVIPSNAFKLIVSKGFDADNPLKFDNGHITALRKADVDRLSQSDTECLDEAIRLCCRCNEADSKDEAWRKAWNSADNKKVIVDIPVEYIVEQFKNSEILLDYLKEIDAIEALWG